MIPFLDAVEFFLGFWLCLPFALQMFISTCVLLAVVTALIRAVLDL